MAGLAVKRNARLPLGKRKWGTPSFNAPSLTGITSHMKMAFKEWAVVCEALGSGCQSVILRKGGIAEGRGGFAFLHREFFLFPTRFHESLEKTTLPLGFELPAQREGEIEIHFAAKIEWTGFLSDPGQLTALGDFHVLRAEVIEERFRFGKPPGIHIGYARIFRLGPPWILPMEKRFGGCRSWIELPEAPQFSPEPVLSDEENQRRSESLRRLLGLA